MHRRGLLTILLHQSVARHSHSIVVLLQPAGVAVRRRACEIRGGLQLLRGRSRIRIHTYGGGRDPGRSAGLLDAVGPHHRHLRRQVGGGEKRAGHLLPLTVAGGAIVSLSMVLYNFGAEKDTWWVIPACGSALMGMGLFAISMSLVLFLVGPVDLTRRIDFNRHEGWSVLAWVRFRPR